MTPHITIVIGTYNRLDLLRRSIESIRRYVTTPYLIKVTDAGSTDGTIAFLQSQAGDDLDVTFEGRRRGQAKALNDLFAQVSTPYVCWISDDNEIAGDALDRAIVAMERSPSLGMVGLKVRDLQGLFASHPYIGGISSVGIININQGVLRTPLIKNLGGFSEVFGTYGIDTDLTTQVLLAGYDIALTRDVGILHHRGWADYTPEDETHPINLSKRYQALYSQKYAPIFGASPLWFFRRAIWRTIRQTMPRRLAIDSHKRVLGLLVRDWHNIFAARFVSPIREYRHRSSPVYLLQRCPRRFVQTAPVPDPEI